MKYLIITYTFIIGLCASSVFDFILCVIPLGALMYFVTKPRECDVFVFTPEDAELAELFAEYILD